MSDQTQPEAFSPDRRAAVLVETLPYIHGSGGWSSSSSSAETPWSMWIWRPGFAEDIVLMHSVGIRPVVVHGGGPQIGEMLEKLGLESEFRDGLRVTDADTLDVARMVLVGKVNREVVSAINVHGDLAVGLSGEDASLIEASERNPDLGFVGDVAAVNPAILERVMAEDLIPVVATIGIDTAGQAYNINSDTVAAALAGALGAERILYLTDIEGLRADAEDPDTLISRLDVERLGVLMADGTIQGGMTPKAQACLDAVNAGVGSAHMVDGRIPHVLLLELFTDAGIGTMVFPVGGGPDTPARGEGTPS